jgi:uncharacterized membrane protein YozB (DUF420 family)
MASDVKENKNDRSNMKRKISLMVRAPFAALRALAITACHPRLVPLRGVGILIAIVALNTFTALADGTGFSSTDLKTGISNSLAVIMMFGFVLGIAAVIAGGFAIRRGDVDQGKMSIIGGAIIAAAPAVIYAFFKIFGIDSNSSVGVGTFN